MKQEEIRYMIGRVFLGPVLIAISSKGLCALLVGDNTGFLIRDLKKHFSKALLIEDTQLLEKYFKKVTDFLENPQSTLKIPIDERGTPFQKAVWRAVRDIPHDKTSTYKEIAEKIGRPNAYRAVGSACKLNFLAVITPCERVLHSSHALSKCKIALKLGVKKPGRL